MPEGPEVRKYADALDEILSGKVIKSIQARTRVARQWLLQNGDRLPGRRILRVCSHGKHLIGYLEGDFYFHSHLMMWGRWSTSTGAPPLEVDRRERARVVVPGGFAILWSAPIFDIGEGDPYEQIEHLSGLGPDVLPYQGTFDVAEFRRRLYSRENCHVPIGVALLNQQIIAGVGNYLRAEILFSSRINPWRQVSELSQTEVACLSQKAPELARRSYLYGATASEAERNRLRLEVELVYQPGREYGTRHLVFRRTNLPCLRCGEIVRQLRQRTSTDGETEHSRIIYFCPNCQK
jgi:formamidopyrimidine-DNA glycosylase